MAENLTMPKLGFDMAEGTLISWKKQIGEMVNKGDVIADIETDKATIEIEAQTGGKLLEFLVQPGDVVPVGAAIAVVGAEGETASAPKSAPAATEGDTKHPEAVAEAERGGQPGPTPPKTPEEVSGTKPPLPMQQGAEVSGNGGFPSGLKASPIARRIAEEKGVDLSRVQGSGPGGRIVKKDVEDFPVEEAPAAPIQQPAARPTAQPAAAPMPAPSLGELPSGPDVEVIDISKLRRRIAQRMVESQQQVPHFYVTMDMDVSALMDLRKQLNATISDDNAKISVNDLIVKATALTLRQFPNLNTHYYGDKLVRHKRIHIGMAVALVGGGLMNVVAKDADKTSLGTMAVVNREMIARARDGKVKPDDVDGSTFTVSNLGPYDVDFFAAIINPPEAGIIAIGAAKKVPVVLEDGTLGVSMRMKATISVDHRVSDGA
ncbi:MAG TPA: dihydrolipoamide acetyltransferase family protein, partial [Aggregatilineaceae bacterium]|nr:dihydrolipoamide acetyltransferase family protein [Aggregatilineaceae bacterium]